MQLVRFSLVMLLSPLSHLTMYMGGQGTGGTQVAGGLQQVPPLLKLAFASLGPYSVLLLTDCGPASIFSSFRWV